MGLTGAKLLSHLDMHLRVRIHVIEELLIVDILLIPLQGLVIAKVIPQRDEKHLATVKFGLLTILIKEELCPEKDENKLRQTPCAVFNTSFLQNTNKEEITTTLERAGSE